MGAKFKYLFSLCLLVIFVMGQSLYMDILLVEKAGIRIAHHNSSFGNESLEGQWFSLNDQTLSHIKWVDEREFEFQGEMYDVESSSEVNGQRQLWVKKDKRETELNRQIAAHHHGRSECFTSDISTQVNKVFEKGRLLSFQMGSQFQVTSYSALKTERVEEGYADTGHNPPDYWS